MLDYTEIGERIRSYRKKNGYTQEELALTISTSTAYISYIERAIKKPSLQKLAQIAEVFGIPIDSLISASQAEMKVFREGPPVLDRYSSLEKNRLLKNLNELIHIIERSN